MKLFLPTCIFLFLWILAESYFHYISHNVFYVGIIPPHPNEITHTLHIYNMWLYGDKMLMTHQR